MSVAVLAPHDVPTSLNYYIPDPETDESPRIYMQDPPPGKKKNNTGHEPYDVVIRDARDKEKEYDLSLDTSGFQFVKHVSQDRDFEDEERIQTAYYREVEELLKKETGAKRVLVFDHTIRRTEPDFVSPTGKVIRGAASAVHVDQTYDAAVERVHRHLGDEAERLLKGRVRIINVWRPIHNPVAHRPLAVSDWRTVDKEHDLVPVQFIHPDRVGSTCIYSVRHNPNHKWYYLSSQTPDEVTLIKCYDSEVDRARFTPHAAFLDETSPKDAPHRESIEVRCLVFDTE
ncbi:uncharacterized protein PHACADRAFT_130728 [Phanerochaete carnosa HHB-10118-sp]|uniref:Methyltransferase n=1 Tax=Phanerochaete carnosa (strain HHB-10118-sp) TaxID=650164 RepID=K5UKG5_PHACS|nr:uncharacterized protein PHACADRAFT_130728 [Phanerochaete carnosa HHB-10118-sp]EKM50121.1 hypothetical protein PHACADRAFT_130728 [Phanerochaete carnosa HHB-10118-sp]